ncbi:hypothetical protein JCM11491_004048 [Sporobolomyces phaffii]
MPPRRIQSIDLGMPTPGQTQEDESNGGAGFSKIDAMLKRERAAKKKEIARRQQAVLRQADEAATRYKEAVERVTREGEIKLSVERGRTPHDNPGSGALELIMHVPFT